MGVTTILICEDEKLIAERLHRFVETALDFPAKIRNVYTLNQALEHLASSKIDLLFLDLNLHGKDGFRILKQLAPEAFHTIVVSAYTDRAIEAFEYGVLDFIGKPFTFERIKKALCRYKNGHPDSEHHLKYVAIRTRKGVEFIDIKKVDYIQAAGIYSELVLLDGSKKVYDKPMNQLLKLLPEHFLRVHKSYVVPLGHIASIISKKTNSYEAVLLSKVQVPISRRKRKELIERISI